MIVDIRTYTCKPGKTQEFVAFFEKVAWPYYEKYLGRCVGFYTVFDGGLNKVVHLWAFDDAADRETRRANLNADPGFQEFLKELGGREIIVDMENSIAKPANFWKMPAQP